MRKRLRKLLSLTLAASLALSLNTVAFAEEMTEDTVIVDAVDSDTVGDEGSEASDLEVSDEAGLDSVEEAVIDSLGNVDAEGSAAASVTNTVSTPFADPTTWSTDPYYARHTYGIYLPELYGYNDRDMISGDYIWNNAKVNIRKAKTGYDLDDINGYGVMTIGNGKRAKISFNCVPIESGVYFIYAYGIANEFDGSHYQNFYEKNNVPNRWSLSRNNYYGMTPDNVPAGVFDYTRFTWYEKDGGSGANGNIVFEGAVIRWSSGKKAEKDYLIKVDKLTCKNNLYATVSFDAVDGKWLKVKNKFQKSTKQPSFYPVLKAKKSYRNVNGDKIKCTKEDTKLVKRINKTLKANPINFEIRRRPMAGTISEDHIFEEYAKKYTSLMGDDLDFKSNGKLKKAILQFKSYATVKEKDGDSDDFDMEEGEAGTKNTKTQVSSYLLTHVLKINKMKDGEATANVENTIKAGDFHYKTKTDCWYTTRSIGGDDCLIVYGANNMEGVAAFRKRKDTSVGSGFYKDDKNMFIMSVDDEAKVDDAEVEEAF